MIQINKGLLNNNYVHITFSILVILSNNVLITIGTNEPDTKQSPEEHFRKLFSMRRSEQLSAVKGILKYETTKQEMLVGTVTKKIFDVIEKSRAYLESSGYVPGLTEFPTDEKTRDALSNILENTSLMGDIVLHAPDIAIPTLQKNHKYEILLKWSLQFMNQTQLLDKKTNTQMYLVAQELNITEREPNYINPYKKSYQREMEKKTLESQPQPKTTKKKKKMQRGPRITNEL